MNVTFCPPAPAHLILPPEPQFNRKVFAVNAQYGRKTNGEIGFDSSEIAFDDYTRMTTHTHKMSNQRRLDTPAWSLNNDTLANVIATYVLKRASSHSLLRAMPPTATAKLALAKTFTTRRKLLLTAQLDRLCTRYVAAKNNTPRNHEVVRQLEIEIENSDTSLRILDKEAEIAAGVLYHYYHRGADSPAVAAAMKIKPPHVRIILWRLRLVAAELGYGTHIKAGKRKEINATRKTRRYTADRTAYTPFSGKDINLILELNATGEPVSTITYALGYRKGHGCNRVRKVLKKYIASYTSNGVGGRPVLMPCNEPAVVKMFKDGKRVCEIAEEIFGNSGGAAHNRIRAVLRHAGILRWGN